MRRVCQDLHGELLASGVSPSVTCSQMVFSISCVLGPVGFFVLEWHGSYELSEKLWEWFSDNVRKHVESSSMWHTNDSLLSAMLNTSIHRDLHSRDERVTALKAESLHRVEFGGDKLSELVCPVQTVQKNKLLLLGKRFELLELNLVPDPIAMFSVRNMHVFNSNFVAVRFLKGLFDLTKGPVCLRSKEPTPMRKVHVELLVKVGFGKTVELNIDELSEWADFAECLCNSFFVEIFKSQWV